MRFPCPPHAATCRYGASHTDSTTSIGLEVFLKNEKLCRNGQGASKIPSSLRRNAPSRSRSARPDPLPQALDGFQAVPARRHPHIARPGRTDAIARARSNGTARPCWPCRSAEIERVGRMMRGSSSAASPTAGFPPRSKGRQSSSAAVGGMRRKS